MVDFVGGGLVHQGGFPCLVIVLPIILIVCVEKVLSVFKEPQE